MNQRVQDIINEVIIALEKVPELTHAGEQVLRQQTAEVSLQEGKEIGAKLIEVLKRYSDLTGVGGGLAAPQIGLSKSVFVINNRKEERFETYINPKITSRSQSTNFLRESCLSSRTMWCDVERPEEITMEWTDETGAFHSEELRGFKARILQHEFDHLQGILNLDRAIVGTIEYSGDVKEEKLRSQRYFDILQKVSGGHTFKREAL